MACVRNHKNPDTTISIPITIVIELDIRLLLVLHFDLVLVY